MLFVLMIVWHVASQNFSHRKRLHLRAYAVLLLLNDTIRDGHKKKLTDWIRESDARSALNLHERADDVNREDGGPLGRFRKLSARGL